MKAWIKFYLIFAFVISINTINAQSTITFNKTYGSLADNSFNILELSDGYISDFISNAPGYAHHCILKTDFSGNEIWQKCYGTTNEIHINYSLIKSINASYVVGNYCYNTITKQNYIELLKIDSLGDSIWKKSIFAPPGFGYYGSYMIQTSDGGFLISGEIADSLVTDGDGFILKTDSLGNEQWHSVYGGNNFDNFFSSVQLPDNSYLSLGWTRSYGFGGSSNRDVFLVKTDSAGNFLWRKTYGNSYDEIGIGFSKLSDGNFLFTSGRYYAQKDTLDAILTKIDSSGSIIWEQVYRTSQYTRIWLAKECSDGSIIGSGMKTINSNSGFDNGWVVKTDSLGNVLWDRMIPQGNNHGYFRDVQPTTDGGYIAAGFCFQGASGGQDAWLVKLVSRPKKSLQFLFINPEISLQFIFSPELGLQ